jgi:hypothetical protein
MMFLQDQGKKEGRKSPLPNQPIPCGRSVEVVFLSSVIRICDLFWGKERHHEEWHIVLLSLVLDIQTSPDRVMAHRYIFSKFIEGLKVRCGDFGGTSNVYYYCWEDCY